MSLRPIAATLLVLGPTAAPAQSDTAARIDARIVAAERDIADERAEEAARRLRGLLAECAGLFDATERAATEARIEKLLASADKLADRRAKAERDAASVLIDASHAYADRGWLRAASVLCERAAGFDPGAARAAVVALQARAPARDAGHPIEIDLGGGEPVLGDDRDGWSVEATRITSCGLTEKQLVYLSATALPSRVRVAGELVLSDPHACVGFVLGYRHFSDFTIVYASLGDGGGWVAERWADDAWTVLGRGSFRAKLSPEGTVVPLEVDTTAGGLRVRVGDGEPVVVSPPAVGDVVPGGYFGVTAWTRGATGQRVGWRGIRASAFAPQAREYAGSSLDGLLHLASLAIETGDAEAGVLHLWNARAAAQRIEDAMAASRRAAEIDELLSSADPDAQATRAACAAAAKKILPIGSAYVRNGWSATGLELLETAFELDPRASRRKLEEARARAGASEESLLARYFARRQLLCGPDGSQWVLRGGELASPKLVARSTVATRGNLEINGDARIRIETRLSGTTGIRKSGVVFGVRPLAEYEDEYYICELCHCDGYSALTLYFFRPGKPPAKLAEMSTYFPREQRRDWIELTIEKSEARIRTRVGDSEWLEARDLPASVDGYLGCFVSGDSDQQDPVHYRNLRIDEL